MVIQLQNGFLNDDVPPCFEMPSKAFIKENSVFGFFLVFPFVVGEGWKVHRCFAGQGGEVGPPRLFGR